MIEICFSDVQIGERFYLETPDGRKEFTKVPLLNNEFNRSYNCFCLTEERMKHFYCDTKVKVDRKITFGDLKLSDSFTLIYGGKTKYKKVNEYKDEDCKFNCICENEIAWVDDDEEVFVNP